VVAKPTDVSFTLGPKPKKFLIVAFDVTKWSDRRIASLNMEVWAQGEASERHPDVDATSSVVIERDVFDVNDL